MFREYESLIRYNHVFKKLRFACFLWFASLCIFMPLLPHNEIVSLVLDNESFGKMRIIAFTLAILFMLSLVHSKIGRQKLQITKSLILSANFAIILMALLIMLLPSYYQYFAHKPLLLKTDATFFELKFSFSDIVLATSLLLLLGLLFSHIIVKCISNTIEKFECSYRSSQYDSPIINESQDTIGISNRAHLLANRISDGNNIIITGEFGSGKSSLCNLIKSCLSKGGDKDEYLFYVSNYWGKASERFSEEVLSGILDVISGRVDISDVSGVPSSYCAKFKNIDSIWVQLLPFLFNSNLEPIESLRQLDEFLEFHKLKVIVFLEDCDRNSDKNFVNSKLAPFLDDLKSLQRIRFIVTTNLTIWNNDAMLRLASLREDMLPLSSGYVYGEILSLVKSMLSECDDLIMPNPYGSIRRLFDPWNHESVYKFGERLEVYDRDNHCFDDERIFECTNNIVRKISDIPFSLRELKFITRDISSRWNALKGAVDFSDLIVLRFLNYKDPAMYSYFIENMTSHKYWYGNFSKAFEADKEFFKGQENIPENRRQLFAKMHDFFFKVEKDNSPQAIIMNLYHNDYHLKLILECAHVDFKHSDQRIFKILMDYNKGGDFTLLFNEMLGYRNDNTSQPIFYDSDVLSKIVPNISIFRYIGALAKRYSFILSIARIFDLFEKLALHMLDSFDSGKYNDIRGLEFALCDMRRLMVQIPLDTAASAECANYLKKTFPRIINKLSQGNISCLRSFIEVFDSKNPKMNEDELLKNAFEGLKSYWGNEITSLVCILNLIDPYALWQICIWSESYGVNLGFIWKRLARYSKQAECSPNEFKAITLQFAGFVYASIRGAGGIKSSKWDDFLPIMKKYMSLDDIKYILHIVSGIEFENYAEDISPKNYMQKALIECIGRARTAADVILAHMK